MNSVETSVVLDIFLIVILILLNAFFAAAEMSIVSINKTKISHAASEGDEKAVKLLKLLEEPSKFLATIQVGITLAGFFASASAATGLSKRFYYVLKSLNVPGAEQVALFLITILLSYIILVFGELFPKRIGLQYSEKIAMFSVTPVIFISKITLPFVKFLTSSTNILVRLAGINTENLEEKVSEEEIRMMVHVGRENGVIKETEKEMIDSIFEFDNTQAKEVMTPRTNVFALNINTPIDELMIQVSEEKYSRIPVYEEDVDNIIGVLYMKDLFAHLISRNLHKEVIRNMLRAAYFVPETKSIDVLFKELQTTNSHMAILIDEYGGFSGIVTIEDLIEEIMGNIFDEYDEQAELVKKIDNNTYLVDGLLSIEEINQALGIELPENDDSETIAGFVINLLGSIPKEHEQTVIEYENIIFKVESMTDKRIEKLKICLQ